MLTLSLNSRLALVIIIVLILMDDGDDAGIAFKAEHSSTISPILWVSPKAQAANLLKFILAWEDPQNIAKIANEGRVTMTGEGRPYSSVLSGATFPVLFL